VRYEFQHLLGKLRARDPARYEALKGEARGQGSPALLRGGGRRGAVGEG